MISTKSGEDDPVPCARKLPSAHFTPGDWPAPTVRFLPLIVVISVMALAPWLDFLPSSHAARQRPLRLGIVHPYPRFCQGQERSQRDIRLMRLAFRIPAQPWGREALPWYYIRGEAADQSGRIVLDLDTESLWDRPRHQLPAADPGSADEDALKPWREQVLANVPGLEQAASPSPAQFIAPPGRDFPYWRSRLGGSAVLPYLADSITSGYPCIRWPKDIVYTAGTRTQGYALRFTRAGGTFRLTAYLTLKAMLRDLRRGRLAAALVDGGELITAIEARMELPQPVVGRGLGTQQIVLKPRPKLLDEIELGTMRALSRAIPRVRLAHAAGPDFMPSRAYLGGAGATPIRNNEDPLAWDTRGSRRNWLNLDNAPRRLTLAVLAHPRLQRVAENLASQWKKTLGLELDISVLAVEKFYLPGGAEAADFSLLVVDQDDGSLQDLWRSALETSPNPPAESEYADAEALLRQRLPYLPLLKNAHFLLASSPASYGRVAHFCSGCDVSPLQSYRRGKRP